MTYPANYEVGWHTASEGSADARGNPTTVYTPALNAAGTVRRAINPAPSLQTEPNETRVESDIDLYVPPDFGTVNPKDVCDLPYGQFEVVGYPEDWTAGFHGWQPGIVIKLKRLEG